MIIKVFGKACYISWFSYFLTINTHYNCHMTHFKCLRPLPLFSTNLLGGIETTTKEVSIVICLPIIVTSLLLLLLLLFIYPRILNCEKSRKSLAGHYKGHVTVAAYLSQRHSAFPSLAASGSPQKR
jgi:hypothetical protein